MGPLAAATEHLVLGCRVFAAQQRAHPERFSDRQLRTLQRRINRGRASEGPAQGVYFVQEHRAGELRESDFTHVTKLGITRAASEQSESHDYMQMWEGQAAGKAKPMPANRFTRELAADALRRTHPEVTT